MSTLSPAKQRLYDKLTSKPKWAPHAVLTPYGWVDENRNEVLVALSLPKWIWEKYVEEQKQSSAENKNKNDEPVEQPQEQTSEEEVNNNQSAKNSTAKKTTTSRRSRSTRNKTDSQAQN